MRILKEKGFYVLLAGLVCIGIGLWRGEDSVVLQKAIHICLECIGL